MLSPSSMAIISTAWWEIVAMPCTETTMTSTSTRNTWQRAAVRALLANTEEFRTAAQIHSDLRQVGDKVGLATVYRALQTMSESGDLDVLRTPDGEAAYRMCSNTHHHHLVCRSCGMAVEI